MRKWTTTQLRLTAEAAAQAHTLAEWANLFGLTEARLLQTARTKAYNTFWVPKRNGGKRLIEDPAPTLKAVQRRINEVLQACFWTEKPDAVYGFVVNPVDLPSEDRHILTHAERHLGCRQLINVDLEDFFHQVSRKSVEHALGQPPLNLSPSAAECLADVCTWKERLPMGAPTSPVLSNWVFRPVDLQLTHYARERGWLYTRYADDLTFSTRQTTMVPADLEVLVAWMETRGGFRVHPEKRRFSDVGDLKVVTQLVLSGQGVQLPEAFEQQLHETLSDLEASRRVHHRMGGRHAAWLEDYANKVEGLLGFARYVLGEKDPVYRAYAQRYDDAQRQPPETFGAYSWLDFPYP